MLKTEVPLKAENVRRRKIRAQRGVASVLAMLYLVLFSTLAVGFAAATAINSQISRNDRGLSEARFAADAGMSFTRYQLGQLNIPSGQTGGTLLATVATQLGTLLNGTANMGGHQIAVTNGTIYIPAQGSYIATATGTASKFRVAITASNSTLTVTSTGYDSSGRAARADQLQYQQITLPSAIFNYGMAAKGEITGSGGATIQGTPTAANGTVLSATASSVALSQSGGTISGDFFYTNAAATNTYGGTIAGYSKSNSNFASHVHGGVAAPQFPSVDTSVYAQYATNTWSSSTGSTVVNCTVPAGANPSFPAGTTVQGVLYIQTPNKVTFSGSCTIQGVVVVQNNPTGTSNSLTFSGGVTAQSISTLPASSQFPADERALTGAFLLAPSFAVTMSGSFGTIGGSMIADSFNFSGSVTANVTGSIIALKDPTSSAAVAMSGGTVLTVSGAGTTGYPPGVNFGYYYIPVQGSYMEVIP